MAKNKAIPVNVEMKKRGVLTSYSTGGRRYGSYVLCKTQKEATTLVKERNIGERVDSQLMNVKYVMPDYSILSDKEFIEQLPEILHSACFMGYIAMQSGRCSAKEILGDGGVVHEISHLIAFGNPVHKGSLKRGRRLLRELQDAIPGMY